MCTTNEEGLILVPKEHTVQREKQSKARQVTQLLKTKKGKLIFSKNEPPGGLSQSKWSTIDIYVYEQH